MPPSAIIGRFHFCASAAHSITAYSCGTPTPATTRVVQIDPAPSPTRIASAPASANARTPSRVATLPAITSRSGSARLISRTAFSTPCECPCAESMTMKSTPASASARARSTGSRIGPTAAPTTRRPLSSLVAFGCCRIFSRSLMVISPRSLPRSSTIGSFSILCFCRIFSASSRLVPTGAVIRFSLVITSWMGRSKLVSKRMSRLVRMPTK
jgi:hypothetical protein